MAENLDLSALDIGISSSGMDEYKQNLKATLLTETTTKLMEEYENVMAVINTGWQGVSRDRFDTQFKTMCETIGADLDAEYADLEARFAELQAFYFEQDRALIEE